MSAKLGAAASKSSLAAAARGQVLPSWETTWEFVRVLAVERLGQEPEETEREWRERWEKARIATLGIPDFLHGDAKPVEHGGSAEAAEGKAAGSAEVGAVAGSDPEAEITAIEMGAGGGAVSRPPAPQRVGNRMRLAGVAALTTAIVGGGSVAAVVLAQPGDRRGEETPTSAGQQSQAVTGDDAQFEGDVTYPDGTVVDTGERFTKTWRLRNIGTVSWRGRYLTRINTTACDAPDMVPITETRPGKVVEISVQVRAATRPAQCKIYWKMTDAKRTPLLPGKRPIFLDVQVKDR
jgi:hypothetical protein